jgi:Flp pilus assembly protein TadG
MKTVFPFLAKLARCRRGNAMLEFAIGSGVLVSVFAGTFQFGYTFYQYNLLKNAVSDGARYASLRTYDSSNSTPSNAFQTAVQNMVVYGDPGGSGNPIAPGLTTSNVNLAVTFTAGVPTAMSVSITGYTIGAVFGTTTLTGKPNVTYAYQGIFAPY